MLTSDGSNESPAARVERDPSNSLYLSLGEWPRAPFTARIERPSSFPIILPSLLASLHWNGTVLIPLRPSNEHILIVRVPGARDQHSVIPPLSSCAFCEQEGHLAAPFPAGGLYQQPASNSLASCLLRFRWSPQFSQPPSRWRTDLRDRVSPTGTDRLSHQATMLQQVHRREPRTLSPVGA